MLQQFGFSWRSGAGLLLAMGLACAQATTIGPVLTGAQVPDWAVGNYSCSATLITPRVALTAGHCLKGVTENGFYYRKTAALYMGNRLISYPKPYGALGDVGLVLFPQPFAGGGTATAPIPSYSVEEQLLQDPTPANPAGTVLTVYGQDHTSNNFRGAARMANVYSASRVAPLTYRTFAGQSDLFFFKYKYFWWDAGLEFYALLYKTPVANGGLGFTRADTDDLIVGFTEFDPGRGTVLLSPVTAGDSGGGIFARGANTASWLVASVSGTVVHPRLSAYWPWVYAQLLQNGLRSDAVGLARQVLGTAGWGSNDRKGNVGDIYVYENPYNGDVEFFRLVGLGSDARYWYFPTDKKDNLWWEYLGTALPSREQATVPVLRTTASQPAVVGGVYAKAYGGDVAYYRLKSMNNGVYGPFPADRSDNTWWTYIGTDVPARKIKYVD